MTKVSLKNLKIENFKGIREKEIKFPNTRTTIKGRNGVGKTTVLTAWIWLICNKDALLTSNPAVFPIGDGEYTPTVTAELDVNGVSLTIKKSQKRKVSKPNEDGISKVSTTNSYEVNSVEVSERDFYKTLAEKGIASENFAITSHTDAFMALKPDERRKILFGFSQKSDEKSIVNKAITSGIELPSLAEKIKNYSLNEIESMAKSTIRKIKEVYGKDGEILNAQINGLDMGKADVDMTREEIELKRKQILEEKSAIAEKTKAAYEEHTKKVKALKDESDDATIRLKELMNKYNKLMGDSEKSQTVEIANIRKAINELNNSINEKSRIADRNNFEIQSANASIADMMETVRQMNERENLDVVCPTCGQPLPVENAMKIKQAEKATKNTLLNSISSETERLNDLKESNSNIEFEIQAQTVSLVDYQAKLETLENQPVKPNKDAEKIAKEIEKQKQKSSDAMTKYTEFLKAPFIDENASRVSELDDGLIECSTLIAKHDMNDDTNRKIADLRKKQVEYEQAKANAEEVLDEIDRLNRFSNLVVTDEINAFFKEVKWKFFDYKKNGEYTEVCDAYIDEKKLGESANTGRELIAKIDIVTSLQKMFEQTVPLFVDGFECLSSDSIKRLDKVDSQLIALSVSEDKELTQ